MTLVIIPEIFLLHLEYLEPQGMSMALPPESVHVVLLGIIPQIVHGNPRCVKLFKN